MCIRDRKDNLQCRCHLLRIVGGIYRDIDAGNWGLSSKTGITEQKKQDSNQPENVFPLLNHSGSFWVLSLSWEKWFSGSLSHLHRDINLSLKKSQFMRRDLCFPYPHLMGLRDLSLWESLLAKSWMAGFRLVSSEASLTGTVKLSLIHIWRCRRGYWCRSRWSPYH